MSDEHVRSGFDVEKISQSDDHESGKIDVSLAVDETLHRHDVLLARPDRKVGMGMPFAEVVEAFEVRSGLLKEAFEGFCMMFRAAHKMRGRPGFVVHREVDDPKMVRCNLLTHEDAPDFASASPSQAGA